MDSSKKGKQKKDGAKECGKDNLPLGVGGYDVISNKDDLKKFLLHLRDRMAEKAVAPIYAVSAMNHVLNLDKIYSMLDNENKELARDIWLRVRQSGMQVKNPPLLFSEDGDSAAVSGPS